MTQPWLNYHHLYYFWSVAKLGSITAACQDLNLSQPTISSQLRALEDNLGAQLFERVGKRLRLTEAGHLVLSYSEQIFSLGREMVDSFRGRPMLGVPELTIGIADVIPKLIAHRVIEPVLDYPGGVHLSLREDHPDQLLGELAVHKLDLVLSDSPIPHGLNLKGSSHLIGESGVQFFAPIKNARILKKKRFPQSLTNQTLLLPGENTTLGRQIEQWIKEQQISIKQIVRFDDSALMKSFGSSGDRVFPSPSVLSSGIRQQYGALPIGEAKGVTERFYLISPERQIRHPVVVYLLDKARRGLR